MEAALNLLAMLFGKAAPAASGPVPLTRAPRGKTLIVTALSIDNPMRSDRLASLGIAVGSEIVVLQRRPTYVIQAGETTLALDGDLARTIVVEKA